MKPQIKAGLATIENATEEIHALSSVIDLLQHVQPDNTYNADRFNGDLYVTLDLYKEKLGTLIDKLYSGLKTVTDELKD